MYEGLHRLLEVRVERPRLLGISCACLQYHTW